MAGGGGIGTRGPGETKIETDRRRIRARVTKLRRELAEMSAGRQVQRGQRRRREVPSVAIAPEMSSRYFAVAAMAARALSLTADGAMPSAQLMELSAVALDEAVRDHFHKVMGLPCD